MPELPEVETIVRGLHEILPGKTIRRVEVRHEKVIRPLRKESFEKQLVNKKIFTVERQGKFIHFLLAGGESLVVHLKMTGKFIVVCRSSVPDNPHIRLVFHCTGGTVLLYNDLRIFGVFRVYKRGETIGEFTGLGRDPVRERITSSWFLTQCRKRTIAVKPLLLDQRVLAGLGNIYASEALFRAGISPFARAGDLGEEQAHVLLKEIRSLLRLAIKHNGTSIRDFRAVDDQAGSFQKLLRVYGREGQPCPRCRKAVIRRVRQAQRSTFYCPVCQQ